MATVNLTWANTSTGGTRTGFRIWRLLDAGGAPADAAALIADGSATEMTSITSGLSSSATSVDDTTAATSSTYYYALKATNAAGDSPAAASGSDDFATVVIA